MWEKAWLEQYPKICFHSGERIFRIGDHLQYNYYLISGICARVFLAASGDEIILNYFHPGKMIGIYSACDQEITEEFLTKTECICYKVPCKHVENYTKQHVDFLYDLQQELSNEYWQQLTLHIARSLGGGISVIGIALKSLAVPQLDGSFLVDPIFTNVELSKYCGIHVVSVSRLLAQLSKDGIIVKSADGIIICNMKRLDEYIDFNFC